MNTPGPPSNEPISASRRSSPTRLARAVVWPVVRLLDSRFADTNRRLDATRLSLHQESNLTRDMLEQNTNELRRILDEYSTVNAETLTFMATQMRHLQHEIETLSKRIDETLSETGTDAGPTGLRD